MPDIDCEEAEVVSESAESSKITPRGGTMTDEMENIMADQAWMERYVPKSPFLVQPWSRVVLQHCGSHLECNLQMVSYKKAPLRGLWVSSSKDITKRFPYPT